MEISHDLFKRFCKADIVGKCMLTENKCIEERCPPFIHQKKIDDEIDMQTKEEIDKGMKDGLKE